MGTKRDYYEVLGIDKNADENTIKKAYRKLAKRYHPDSNEGDPQAEEKFKEVTEAYNVLSDKEKKKLYDQFGHAAFEQGGGTGAGGYGAYGTGGSYGAYGAGRGGYANGGAGGFGGSGYREFHFEGGGMDDILKNFFGGGFGTRGSAYGGAGKTGGSFGGNRGSSRGNAGGGGAYAGNAGYTSGFSGADFFGEGFGNGSYGDFHGGSCKGEDLRAEITVSFEEAVFGCEKLLKLSGSDGAHTIKVQIPAGIDAGKTIRLRGKGNPGISGGEPGDLLLRVAVAPKPGFERKGADIYTTADIPFTTAVFGGEARVHTLRGDVLCKIAPGTQSGTKIRIRGKGAARMGHSGECGDLYAVVQIQVPTRLSREAAAKLREYQAAQNGFAAGRQNAS